MQQIKEQTISNEKDLLKFYFVYAKYKKNVEEIEVPEELTNKVKDDLVQIEVGKICENEVVITGGKEVGCSYITMVDLEMVMDNL